MAICSILNGFAGAIHARQIFLARESQNVKFEIGDSLHSKQTIKSGGIILLVWIVTFVLMFTAYYGYLPRQIQRPVFLISSSCAFPYQSSALSDGTKEALTITHWIASILLFALFCKRLPTRWAFIVALVTIPIFAFIGRTLVHVFSPT